MKVLDLSSDTHIKLLMKGDVRISTFKKFCKKLYPNEYEVLTAIGCTPSKCNLVIVEEDGNLFYWETSVRSGDTYVLWESYI